MQWVLTIIVVAFGMATIYLVLIHWRIQKVSEDYSRLIDSPYKAAINRQDWDACEEWAKKADAYLADYAQMIWNPLRWL